MSDVAGTLPSTRPKPLRLPFLRWGLVAVVQLFLIAIPLADRFDVQRNGQVVPLELVPVDPRDLLRGDYVIINLAINNLSKDLSEDGEIAVGDKVFVGLRAGAGKAAQPIVVTLERDNAGNLAMSGTVRSVTENEIRIDYGIDAFFLPEGEGRVIERLDTSRVLLEIAVTEDGRSLPLTLLVDGKAFQSDAAF
ncbi:GDYXXLXY domain-containing protein [uncultured Roseibium sp.]|uniref:GDYXXLXY domain-containing protein n=1 Tax=uncultured Roseibium sp. TaxID=1936171 RepID=UPI00262E7E30|nr:GDYXXLXY domain-containing protein [uncultured Roseibium sp.]